MTNSLRGEAVSAENQFDALEKKITQALQKLSDLKETNSDLKAKLEEAKTANRKLSKRVADMEKGGKTRKNIDVDRLRGQVDSLLEKFDELEL